MRWRSKQPVRPSRCRTAHVTTDGGRPQWLPHHPEDSLPIPLPTAPPQPPQAAPKRCTTTPPVPLRLVSFNIRRGEGDSAAMTRVVAEIDALDPDVVLVQEVDRFHPRSARADQAATLAESLGMHQSYSANVVRAGAEYGTLVLSRHPIADHGRVVLPATGPGVSPGPCTGSNSNVGSARVTVFNTHLEAVRPRVRVRQARRVLRIVRRHRGPAVLGGDLNSWPASGIVADLSTHLTDTWTTAPGPGATTRGGRRIDYLFVTDHFRPVRAGTVASAVSDHHQVWADVRLRGSRRCTRDLRP